MSSSRSKVVWIAALAIVVVAGVVSAQDDSDDAEERVRSIREERREILLYGIDSQVLELIEKIGEERDDQLLDDVYATFKLSLNPKVRVAALELFEKLDYRSPFDDAVEIVRQFEAEDRDLVIASIGFVSHKRSDEVADLLLALVDSTDDAIAGAAIRGIGATGSEAHARALLERFEDGAYEAERKPGIILAFGELGSREVVESLVEILDDPDEEMTWRRYACDALGRIGDPRGIPSIMRALAADDAMLRAYAISAIGRFEGEKAVSSLMQGLRDSFWRVRVSAARALGEKKAVEAIPILEFKARRDPETKVRDEAIRALAQIGSEQAFSIIRELYEDRRFNTALRVTCVEVLTRSDLDASIDSFIRVIDQEWGEKESRILERTGYYLSLSEHPELEKIFARFLDAGDLVLTIYGIRGAERNGFAALRERIESLAAEGNNRSIRRAAVAALETL